jgi:hypothetical protein
MQQIPHLEYVMQYILQVSGEPWINWIKPHTPFKVTGSEEAYLMSTAYQVEIMFLQELGDCIGAKCVRDPTVIFSPPLDILFRICPKQIT